LTCSFFLRFVKSLFHSKKRYFFVFYTVVKVRHKRKSGGDEENRTPDPLLARQVLSQLSYTPTIPLPFSRIKYGGPRWT
jgi:hypothetical protein